MATTVGQLDIRMNLELQRLEAQIDTANKKIASMSRRMQSDVSSAAKNINKALGAIGVGLSVSAVVNFGKQVLALGGSIGDLAGPTGLTTDAFQDFSNVAAESGVDAQQVSNAFVQMRKNIQEAADGSQAAVDALNALGLKAVRLQTLAPERQFEEIAKSIARATDKNKAFNAGLEILGAKNAPKLAEVLQRLGTEGFDAVSKSVENLRISPEQLATLDAAGDKLDRLWTTLKVITAKAFVVTVETSGNFLSEAGQFLAFDESNPRGFSGKDFGDKREQENRKSIDPYAEKNAQRKIDNEDRLAKATADAAEAQAKFNKELETADKLAAIRSAKVDARATQGADANIKGLLLGPSEREMADFNERVAERNRLLKEGAEVTASVRSPLEEYNVALSRLNDLQSAGAITADVYDKAVVAEGENYQKATEAAKGYGGTLDDTQEKTSDFQKAVSGMWENIADRTGAALADLLLDSEAKFKDFGLLVARMIAEVALRLAVINPIINGVFGLSGTSALPSIFGAKAGGGPMSAGGTYLVGEHGPELVTPSVNSMVTPNHALASVGGSGGNTYVIDARGADVGVVARLEQSLFKLAGPGVVEKRSLAANANERRRGGGLGRSLGV